MNKFKIRISKKYKTSRKKLSPKDKELLEAVVSKLANGEILEAK